jgi:cell division septal protein FtsQ
VKRRGRNRRVTRPLARGNRRVDRERKAHRRRRVITGIKLAALVALLALAFHHGARLADARGWLDPFRIREVRVVGVSLANPNVMVAEAGLMGEEIHWWTPLHEYARNVERDPLVESATIHRRFPNRVTLEIREREPVALIALERLAPVDSTGQILPVSAFHGEFDAPVLTVAWAPSDVARDGQVTLAPVRAMLARLGEIAIHYPVLAREISAIRMETDGTIELTLVHAEGEVVLDQATPLAKLALVDDVVRDLHRKRIAYDRLDLRFEDQIVVSRDEGDAAVVRTHEVTS